LNRTPGNRVILTIPARRRACGIAEVLAGSRGDCTARDDAGQVNVLRPKGGKTRTVMCRSTWKMRAELRDQVGATIPVSVRRAGLGRETGPFRIVKAAAVGRGARTKCRLTGCGLPCQPKLDRGAPDQTCAGDPRQRQRGDDGRYRCPEPQRSARYWGCDLPRPSERRYRCLTLPPPISRRTRRVIAHQQLQIEIEAGRYSDDDLRDSPEISACAVSRTKRSVATLTARGRRPSRTCSQQPKRLGGRGHLGQ
jgi:hypothetical protein